MRKGDSGDAMYFVSTGAVEVNIGEEPIRLGSGDFFGEISLLKDIPRVADVTAIAYCQLLMLNVREFRTLMERLPSLKDTIDRVAAERLSKES